MTLSLSQFFYIIEIGGGLGNQMFQYAFYLNFKKHHSNTKVDVSGYNENQVHNNFELEKIFKIKADYANSQELATILDRKQSIIHKIKRKIKGYRPHHYYEHSEDYQYKSWIFQLEKPTYLQGCWLSFNYFSDIKEEIVQAFSFPDLQDRLNLDLQQEISQNESVSIHIRRGDYLKSSIHNGICDLDYYKKAIQKIKDIYPHCLFILFSDDPQWTKTFIAPLLKNEFRIVDWNKGLNNYKDMQLMSMCKHNIIANSTFSWWGAWLNQNKSKVVISPFRWFNDEKLNNLSLIPANWYQI